MTNDEFVDAFRADPVAALRLRGFDDVADAVERELAIVDAAFERLGVLAPPEISPDGKE